MRAFAFALGLSVLADVGLSASEPPAALLVPDVSGAMDAYDPAAGRWERVEAGGLSVPGQGIGIHSARRLVLWGGTGDSREEIAYFELRSRSWKKIPRPPIEPRDAYAAAVRDDRLAVWGGTRAWASYDADGAVFDFRTGLWEALPPAPIEGRAWPGAVFCGSRLVVGGGYGTVSTGYADGAVFDFASRTWKRIEKFLQPRRACPTMVPVGGRVFLWNGSAEAAWLLDPESGSREELPAAPLATGGFSGSALLGSRLFLFGGYGENSKHVRDALEFDLRAMRWRKLPDPPLTGRYNPTVTALRGKVYVFGGLGDGDAFPEDAAVFDPREDRWTPLPKVPGSSRVTRLYY
jgi:N-acetylneuraminic acid mutarotase